MVTRFSAPVRTGPGAHPSSCTMGTGFFPGIKSGRGVTLTPHPFWCRGHERVEIYLYSPCGPYGLYRASVAVQGCTLPYLYFYLRLTIFLMITIIRKYFYTSLKNDSQDGAVVYVLDTDWKVLVSKPGVGGIFRTGPDRSRSPPNLLYLRYRVRFPGGKASGARC